MNNKYIGKNCSEINAIFRQYGLTPLRNILTPNDFEEAAEQTIKIKRRQRIFTPETTFWLITMVGVFCDSMGSALRSSWELIRPVNDQLPALPASEPAFTKARKRLPLDFFKMISDKVINYFRKQYADRSGWKGFQVKIVDGVTLTLPESKELRSKFGSRKNQKSKSSAPVQAKLVGLFYAFTGICEGFAIGSLRLGEKTGLLKVLALLKAGDLLIGDRGFVGYELFWAVIKSKADFLFRLKKDVKPYRRKKIGPKDWLVVFKKPKNCRHVGLPEEITLRLIAYDIKGHRRTYFLTTLAEAEKYTREELINLYPVRWQIETRYNELKHMIKIEQLRSTSRDGIVKEIITHIILANLVRLIMIEAAQKEGLNATDLSYKHALEKVKDTILVMMSSSVYHWPFIYRRMIEEISQMKILKRPGREYPRKVKRPTGIPKRLFVEVSYAKVS